MTSSAIQVTVAPPTGLPPPAPWAQQDIGSVGQPGSATYSSNGTFAVSGSGADIWDVADALQYVYQASLGDVTLIARVVSVQNTDGYAKAGLMVRETLDPGAANAMTFITPSSVADLQSRATSGGLSSYIQGVSATPPYWLKLDRRGDTFNGYGATDGTNWLLLGSVTIPMTNTIYAGLAVTAHNSALLNTATFDHVQLVHPGALVPPALGISRLKGGAIQLTISGPIGVRYSLEASTNLANWLPIATNLNTTGTIQIQPPLSSRVLSKFFRVVVQP